MQSLNLLQHIASYLPYTDLCSLAQANRTCNLACNNPDLWRRECLRLWASPLSFFGTPVPYSEVDIDWKLLVLTGAQVPGHWQVLDDYLFTYSETQLLAQEFVSALIDPPPPLIQLQRESHAFSTAFQDYFSIDSFACEDFMDIEEDWMKAFEDQVQLVYSEALQDLDLLHSARWNLPEPGLRRSLGAESMSTTDSDNEQAFENKSQLVKLCQAIKATTEFWCEFTRVMLMGVTSDSDLIHDYSRRWNAFSAAALHLDQKCTKFNAVFNEVYSAAAPFSPQFPKFSVLRLMAIQWRRSVLDYFQDKLVDAGANMLALTRSTHDPKVKAIASENLWRLSTSLLDLSVNELSVHFSQHTQFKESGPYFLLHDRLVKDTAVYYASLPYQNFRDSVHSASGSLRQELIGLSQYLLPCTISECRRAADCFVYRAWESCILQKCDQAMSQPFRQTDDAVSALLTQPVGLLLAKRRSAEVVRDFFKTCSSESLGALKEFNAMLLSMREKPFSDYAIERRAEILGLELAHITQDRFSLAQDWPLKMSSEVFPLQTVI